MTGLSTAALTELLSTAFTTAGLALLLAAGCVRCLYRSWAKSRALFLTEHGQQSCLRWHTVRYEIHEEPWPAAARPPEPGAEVTVYYRARHPAHWRLTAPYGWLRLLAGAGVLLAAVGVLVPFLAR